MFDDKNNDLVLRSGSYTADQVRQLLCFGLTGPGLQSSNKAINEGLAYLQGSTYIALWGHTFDGVMINPGDVVVKYTYLGDTTFKGYVNATDFAQLDASWLKVQGGKANLGFGWINGDFDYDGQITANDFAILDAAFLSQTDGTLANDPYLAGNAAMLGLSVADYSALVAAQLINTVPEPGSMALLGIGLCAVLGQRKRR
ncbi:MAG: dockerin type I domain-containing protein [Phycisphaerae bacterium]